VAGQTYPPRLPVIPWTLLQPLACPGCGKRHAVTPCTAAAGVHMRLHGPTPSLVTVRRPRAADRHWAVEPRGLAMLVGVPGVVRVLGVTTTPAGHPAVALECHEVSLAAFLAAPPRDLPLAWRLRVAERLVGVMAAVSRRGVVHGALCPADVMLVNKDDPATVDVVVGGCVHRSKPRAPPTAPSAWPAARVLRHLPSAPWRPARLHCPHAGVRLLGLSCRRGLLACVCVLCVCLCTLHTTQPPPPPTRTHTHPLV
jgi:hypothetical protein